MATQPAPGGPQGVPGDPATVGPVRAVSGGGASGGGDLARPTAGMVLHRVLAASARTFLINDLNADPSDVAEWCDTVDSRNLKAGVRPLWSQTPLSAPEPAHRRGDETERVHQARVSMRRIRSNLRTFRLALDPKWATALRGELAWYGRCLGRTRDLHIIQDVVVKRGPGVIDPYAILRIESEISSRLDDALAEIARQRGGARRFQLTEQMLLLWEGPDFKPKAARPASEVMPAMLRRSWVDLRNAARTARKDSKLANLHALRIRAKNLRYGCETVALIEGGAARKTARAAENVQVKLGDLLDAANSIDWFEKLAEERPDLEDDLGRLVEVQREAAATARKGWKREVKEIERRWRAWQS